MSPFNTASMRPLAYEDVSSRMMDSFVEKRKKEKKNYPRRRTLMDPEIGSRASRLYVL